MGFFNSFFVIFALPVGLLAGGCPLIENLALIKSPRINM